jgi:hypothetical protein
MGEESDNKVRLAPVILSMLASLVVVFAGLVIEYKTGWFQRLDNPSRGNNGAPTDVSPSPTQPPPADNRPRFPPPYIYQPPGTPSGSPQKVDIGKLYRRFLHDPTAGTKEYADGRVLEVTGDVSSKHLLSPENQPFTLVLESEGHRLFCTFNNEDDIKGIDTWHRVTVRGQLRLHYPDGAQPFHLDLYDCRLINQDWKLSIYLKMGFAAFTLLSLLLYALWRNIFKR